MDRKEYKRQWHLRNRERMLAMNKARYYANRDAILAANRAAYAAEGSTMKAALQAYERNNREKIRERQRKYRREHPDVMRAIRERRRDARARTRREWHERNRARVAAYRKEKAAKYREYARLRYGRLAGSDGHYTEDEWQKLLIRFDGMCGYCLAHEADSADHRTPLSRGGSNTIDNIIPSCRSCNSRKNNKTEAEFRAEWPVERLNAVRAA